MLDLINTTHSRYYKLYRKKQLENVIGSRTENPTHLANLHEKEEQMRQKCVLRVKEKDAELKEADNHIAKIFFHSSIFDLFSPS